MQFTLFRSLAAQLFLVLIVVDGHAESPRAQPPFYRGVAPGTVYLFPERIPWKNGELRTIDRGFVFVPINRSKPEAGVIPISFTRLPRQASAPRHTPPIVMLTGGPLVSIDEALASYRNGPKGAYTLDPLDLTEISDVIDVDQRGMTLPYSNHEHFKIPDNQPFYFETFHEQLRRSALEGKAFWNSTGLDMAGFTAKEAAADVDAVRQALGYPQVTLMGGSWGSTWAMAVMHWFPHIVARAAIDGIYDANNQFMMGSRIRAAHQRVAADVEKIPAFKELIPAEGLVALAERLVRQFKNKPVNVTIDDPSTGKKITLPITDFDASLYLHTFELKAEITQWPARVLEVARGDYTGIARASLAMRRLNDTTLMFYAIDCSTGISLERRQELLADPFWEHYGRHFVFPFPICDELGADQTQVGDVLRRSFNTAIPTLIIQGDWDGMTPFENAVEVAPRFSNSKFIRVRRAGHDVYQVASGESPEFVRALRQFLITGEMQHVPAEIELPVPEFTLPKQ
jgi:pimeloyl-ACP methyl ester carboxylesterase